MWQENKDRRAKGVEGDEQCLNHPKYTSVDRNKTSFMDKALNLTCEDEYLSSARKRL
jgi:hypothetical protein